MSYDKIFFSLFNLMYTGVLIVGAVTLTLAILLYMREKDGVNRALLILTATVFIYMIVDYITVFFISAVSHGGFVFALITVSDTLFCVMALTWIYAVSVMADTGRIINIKLCIIVSVLYVILSQAISLIIGEYGAYSLHVENGMGKIVLLILNLGYNSFLIGLALYMSISIVKYYENRKLRNIYIATLGFFSVYMVWTGYWDYSTWYLDGEKLMGLYAKDPFIFIYLVLSGMIIYYFYKTNPLGLYQAKVTLEEKIRILSSECGLTDRELEVVSLVCDGYVNKEIADELYIAENTVKRHMSNILKKTNCRNRQDLVVLLR